MQVLKLATSDVTSLLATYRDATRSVASLPVEPELATSFTAPISTAPMHKFSRHRGLRFHRNPLQRVQGHFGFTQ